MSDIFARGDYPDVGFQRNTITSPSRDDICEYIILRSMKAYIICQIILSLGMAIPGIVYNTHYSIKQCDESLISWINSDMTSSPD